MKPTLKHATFADTVDSPSNFFSTSSLFVAEVQMLYVAHDTAPIPYWTLFVVLNEEDFNSVIRSSDHVAIPRG